MSDKTWELTVKFRVTTMSGWEPYREDVPGLIGIDKDAEFELVKVTEVKA